jgi:hypothetical protein
MAAQIAVRSRSANAAWGVRTATTALARRNGSSSSVTNVQPWRCAVATSQEDIGVNREHFSPFNAGLALAPITIKLVGERP